MIETIEKRILAGESISKEEAIALLDYPKEELYQLAARITSKFMGNKFDTCSIMNAKSGNCSEDCKWCAQSAHYCTASESYALKGSDSIVAQALYNAQQGVGRFSLVASGKAATMKEVLSMSEAYKAIKRQSNVKCCASLGLLNEEQLQILFDSGVTTYHCNMETAPSYFTKLCSTHTQADKEATIRAARKVGMRVCSGGIIGMGETMEQRLEFAFYLRSLEVYSIPINILQPIPGTPLADSKALSEDEYLTTVALFRIINPQAYLRFSGGRAQLSLETQAKAIEIGINAAITGDLLTTVGSSCKQDMKLIEKLGKINTNDTDWEQSYDH